MTFVLQRAQASTPGEAPLVQHSSPLTHLYACDHLDSSRTFSHPNSVANSLPPPPIIGMRTAPQRPGPSGSRVVKKRSIPRLGDHLPAIFTHDAALPSSTVHTAPEISATLTSTNLNRLAKSARSSDSFVLVDTISVCSDEDVVLIGTPNQSLNSKSSRHSSRSGIAYGDETPPTTLTADDSFSSSDSETTLNLSTQANNNGFYGFTLPSTYELGDFDKLEVSAKGANYLSPSTISVSDEPSDSPRRLICHHTTRPIVSSEPAPSYLDAATTLADGIIPDTNSLHGIVRGFLATDKKAKSIAQPTTENRGPSTFTPKTPNKARTVLEPQRIFEFNVEGANTPETTKETTKHNGYVHAIPVIDEIQRLEKTKQSLPISGSISKTPNGHVLAGFTQLSDVSATVPRQDQHTKFMHKLTTCIPKGQPNAPAKPLHIFVDMSNIHIGFCNSWKISQNIPVDQRIRAPAFNFRVLSSIMERNRAVKKKFLASSVASHVLSRTQWPQHFIDAERQGYRTSILSRVQKVSPVKVGRGRRASPQGPGLSYLASMMASGDESNEDVTKMSYETRNGEQGVDEILHLNMMNSILDDIHEPGCMVLATGDAAQAEFSEGFLEYATRALSQGWNLELVTWKRTISSAWIEPVFRNRFAKQFRIIYLDDFLEELNADLSPFLA
ncbi:hypothetical protein F5Y03DRAFT_401522 [Xylaria venustula]|nr:hypothetical protein F5Y03DRAFT_401522 [Xylaria venustula]